jgi:protein tyrosine/serine phosphatase
VLNYRKAGWTGGGREVIAAANKQTMTARKIGNRWICWGRRLLLVLLAPGLAVGLFVLYVVAHHNFHVVSPGRVYRSAQMNSGALAAAIRDRGIKSILNLRGPGEGKDWYTDEMMVARRYGVRHYDFSLSASRELSDAQMEQILVTLNRAPKPILIHCKSGSDRTGLVGALYLYGAEGRSAETADRQLAVFYGHIPLSIWGGSVAMDNSFWRYVKDHAQVTKLAAAHSPAAFR